MIEQTTKVRCHRFTLRYFSVRRNRFQNGPDASSFSVGISGPFSMTLLGSTILCRIAHKLYGMQVFTPALIYVCALGAAEVSSLDQLFLTSGAIMMMERSTSSLFQVI
jgi:hypothetical protein